jgi:hypothetical protein
LFAVALEVRKVAILGLKVYLEDDSDMMKKAPSE